MCVYDLEMLFCMSEHLKHHLFPLYWKSNVPSLHEVRNADQNGEVIK